MLFLSLVYSLFLWLLVKWLKVFWTTCSLALGIVCSYKSGEVCWYDAQRYLHFCINSLEWSIVSRTEISDSCGTGSGRRRRNTMSWSRVFRVISASNDRVITRHFVTMTVMISLGPGVLWFIKAWAFDEVKRTSLMALLWTPHMRFLQIISAKWASKLARDVPFIFLKWVLRVSTQLLCGWYSH